MSPLPRPLALGAALALLAVPSAHAITADPFGPNGEGGVANGQSLTIGSGGEVFELDAFVNVGGLDLNGATFGTSAQLSVDALPAGLSVSFASSLSLDATDLTLSYTITNATGAALADVTFISFLDVEIDAALNGFFNEIATTSGMLAPGQGFEADEPGFLFGDIFDNALLGTLDDSNAFPPPEDVAMALSFDLALADGESAIVDIRISEDGDVLGPFSLTQSDPDSQSTEVTYSGAVRAEQAIPEPGSAVLFAVGVLLATRGHRRR